jgi:hypothetical protein
LATNDNINKDNNEVEEEKEYKVVKANNIIETTKTIEEPLFVNNTKNTFKAIRDNKQEVKGTIALKKRGKSSKKAIFALIICKSSRVKGKELIR